MTGKVTSNLDSPVYHSLHGCTKQALYFTGALPRDELEYFGNSNNIYKAVKFTSDIHIYKVIKNIAHFLMKDQHILKILKLFYSFLSP